MNGVIGSSVWAIQDTLIILVTIVTVVFIVRQEQHPERLLLELFSFVFLYAAVYENFATMMGWYGYGRSLVMVLNVPLTIPVVEYLVVYSSLRLLGHMRLPSWSKPILVGFSGMLFDSTLDPLSVRQTVATSHGLIGRWSWYIGPHDVNIFNVPVYNFSGWMLLCGYAAAAFLIGRYWFERSGHSRMVGYLYPPLAAIAALLVLMSPLSRFLLWLAPFYARGSAAEWAMLSFYLILSAAVLVFAWRGRMLSRFSIRNELPTFLVLGAFHLSDLLFVAIGGYRSIICYEVALSVGQIGLLLAVSVCSRCATEESAPLKCGREPEQAPVRETRGLHRLRLRAVHRSLRSYGR